MEWATVTQALIVAGCSWYVRRGNKRDSKTLKQSAETQLNVSQDILDRLSSLELDVALIKRATMTETPDERSRPRSKGLERGKSI